MIRAVPLEPTLPGIVARACSRKGCPEPAAWHVTTSARGRGPDGTPAWRTKALDVCERHRRELAAPARPRMIA